MRAERNGDCASSGAAGGAVCMSAPPWKKSGVGRKRRLERNRDQRGTMENNTLMPSRHRTHRESQPVLA